MVLLRCLLFRGGQGRGRGAYGTTEVLVRAVHAGLGECFPRKKCISYTIFALIYGAF